jgi:Flp pilus assembly protein TadG
VSERGSVTAFVVVLATALIMVTGMVVDGGQSLAAGMDARRLASSAARAGAQELDLARLRAGAPPALDPARAEAAAAEFLTAAGAAGTAHADPSLITVTVHVTPRSRLLPLGPRTITATRSARPVAGIHEGGDIP